MGIVFLILQYFLITLFVLLLMILFIPVIYALDGTKNESYVFFFRASWLWNLLSILVSKEGNQVTNIFIVFFGFHIPINRVEKKKKSVEIEDRKRQKKTRKMNIKYFNVLDQSLLTQLFKFLRRLFRHILPGKFQLNLIYGFSNAADTGMLAGLIAILWPYIPHNDITIYPVFDQEVIQGDLSLKGRIILAVILCYFLQFYFAKGIRKTIRKIRIK